MLHYNNTMEVMPLVGLYMSKSSILVITLMGHIINLLFRRYRHTAYRQLVYWCWGWLGRNNRVPLPACAVHKIRATFPSDTDTGFKYPSLN